MSYQFGPPPVAGQTVNNASSAVDGAGGMIWGNNGAIYRRYLLVATAATTVSEGQPLAFNYSSNFGSAFPISGVEIPVTAFSSEASSNSAVAFAAASTTLSAAGYAQIWGQCYGPGKIQIRGSGASTSCSHGALVSFAANSGYVVSAAPNGTAPAAALYGRMLVTATQNSSCGVTIGSATTDTQLVDAYILGWNPFGVK